MGSVELEIFLDILPLVKLSVDDIAQQVSLTQESILWRSCFTPLFYSVRHESSRRIAVKGERIFLLDIFVLIFKVQCNFISVEQQDLLFPLCHYSP